MLQTFNKGTLELLLDTVSVIMVSLLRLRYNLLQPARNDIHRPYICGAGRSVFAGAVREEVEVVVGCS